MAHSSTHGSHDINERTGVGQKDETSISESGKHPHQSGQDEILASSSVAIPQRSLNEDTVQKWNQLQSETQEDFIEYPRFQLNPFYKKSSPLSEKSTLSPSLLRSPDSNGLQSANLSSPRTMSLDTGSHFDFSTYNSSPDPISQDYSSPDPNFSCETSSAPASPCLFSSNTLSPSSLSPSLSEVTQRSERTVDTPNLSISDETLSAPASPDRSPCLSISDEIPLGSSKLNVCSSASSPNFSTPTLSSTKHNISSSKHLLLSSSSDSFTSLARTANNEISKRKYSKVLNLSKADRTEIVRECTEDFISPSDLAKKWNCNPDTVRTWVRKAGKTLPKHYKKSTSVFEKNRGEEFENEDHDRKLKTENGKFRMICIEAEYIKQNNEDRKDLTQIGCSVLSVDTSGFMYQQGSFFRVIQPPRIKKYISMKMKGDLLKSLHIQQKESGQFEFRDEFEIIDDRSKLIECVTEDKAIKDFVDFLTKFHPYVLVSLDEEISKIILDKIQVISDFSRSLWITWSQILSHLKVPSEEIVMDFEDWFIKHINPEGDKISQHPNALDISSMLMKAIEHIDIKQNSNFYQTLSAISFPTIQSLTSCSETSEKFEYLEIFNSLRPNLTPRICFKSVDLIDLSSDSDDGQAKVAPISWSILPNTDQGTTGSLSQPDGRFNVHAPSEPQGSPWSSGYSIDTTGNPPIRPHGYLPIETYGYLPINPNGELPIRPHGHYANANFEARSRNHYTPTPSSGYYTNGPISHQGMGSISTPFYPMQIERYPQNQNSHFIYSQNQTVCHGQDQSLHHGHNQNVYYHNQSVYNGHNQSVYYNQNYQHGQNGNVYHNQSANHGQNQSVHPLHHVQNQAGDDHSRFIEFMHPLNGNSAMYPPATPSKEIPQDQVQGTSSRCDLRVRLCLNQVAQKDQNENTNHSRFVEVMNSELGEGAAAIEIDGKCTSTNKACRNMKKASCSFKLCGICCSREKKKVHCGAHAGL